MFEADYLVENHSISFNGGEIIQRAFERIMPQSKIEFTFDLSSVFITGTPEFFKFQGIPGFFLYINADSDGVFMEESTCQISLYEVLNSAAIWDAQCNTPLSEDSPSPETLKESYVKAAEILEGVATKLREHAATGDSYDK